MIELNQFQKKTERKCLINCKRENNKTKHRVDFMMVRRKGKCE